MADSPHSLFIFSAAQETPTAREHLLLAGRDLGLALCSLSLFFTSLSASSPVSMFGRHCALNGQNSMSTVLRRPCRQRAHPFGRVSCCRPGSDGSPSTTGREKKIESAS
ncbi:uncharacterized protein LOC100276233 [Zea mays]|uniref:Uncharacterized protein n=1 Tax=Zea mays TaxID=4577 RepID=B6T744_MAIZE|nr:uncharacterized protein LOC100276233 [Zea mays]ACG32927.1 hypothetical protein [Zea mays]|eukprot:NP_001143543.1 uncharacterized protein LOC100276233 [Zea mays]